MEAIHKVWNERQQELRLALSRPEMHFRALNLFLAQHAMTHSGEMLGGGQTSFEDEIWDGLADKTAREIPPKFEHSIVWCIWHITRCEDITMNLLVAGNPQVLYRNDWFARMQVPAGDTGNAMDYGDIANFSAQIDIPALRAYRLSVAYQTRMIAQTLQSDTFDRKIENVLLQQLLLEEAVLPSEQWLIDYWGGLTVGGLLLMPPTRHNLVHLNEAARIKQKCLATYARQSS